MITKFDTATSSAKSGSGGSMKNIVLLAVVLVGGYLVWKYVLNKPKEQPKKDLE
jgi:hypothetical protein